MLVFSPLDMLWSRPSLSVRSVSRLTSAYKRMDTADACSVGPFDMLWLGLSDKGLICEERHQGDISI